MRKRRGSARGRAHGTAAKAGRSAKLPPVAVAVAGPQRAGQRSEADGERGGDEDWAVESGTRSNEALGDTSAEGEDDEAQGSKMNVGVGHLFGAAAAETSGGAGNTTQNVNYIGEALCCVICTLTSKATRWFETKVLPDGLLAMGLCVGSAAPRPRLGPTRRSTKWCRSTRKL